ncbi:MAG TPA: phage tail protein, partial [Thermodesulfovibrio thiophilus]|nr:phage tail protein [Thermodesulfovibrio thiophilus]
MKEIQIQKVKNPFIVEKDEVIAIECKDNETLLDIRNKYFAPDVPCVVVRNGEIVPEEQLPLSYPVQGDTIILTSDLGGGKGGGKNVLRMVLQISLIVVGAVAGQAWLGAAFGVAGLGGTIGATVGAVFGGLLVNTFLPPPKPKINSLGSDFDTSNAYSWNPQPTQQAGLCIPRVYGIHKVESPNIIATNIENINNKQYLNLLFCVGIGRYKNIYNVTINDQPIGYYQGVELHTRLGNLNQAVIPNFNDTKAEYSLGVKVSKGTPYTYLTVGNNFDGIEVDITFPQGLYYVNDKGGLDTNSVDFSIEIRKLGNPNWTPITFKAVEVKRVTTTSRWSLGKWVWDIYGNYVWQEMQAGDSNPYSHYEGEQQRYYFGTYDGYYWCYWRWVIFTITGIVTETVGYTTASEASNSAIRLTYKSGSITDKGKYEIRITRLTDDRVSSRYGDAMYATSVREVYADDFTYPRHALVGIKALATDQLSGSIRLSCMVEGAMVRIYNPDTQTWTVDTTDNPAWIAYDILTKPVFDDNLNVIKYRGFQPSNIKLDEWVDAAQYFDELVPDGKGGYEKRCTFNGIFDSSTSTWSAVLDVLQVGRASPTWDGTKIGIVIDKKVGDDELDDIVQVFGMGNIIKDSFKESWLSSSERAAVITSDFINAEIDYRRDTFTLANKNINSSNSVRLSLFGATKPSQVWRELMFRLKKNELLLNTVTIDAGIEAIRCTIGDKVGVSHDIPQW